MPFANHHDIQIYYEVTGSGPPLLLVHGYGMDSADWREFGYVDSLKTTNTVILMDARGHGRSSQPHQPAAYLWEPLIADVLAVLDAVAVNRVVYWGFSWGAGLGYAAARQIPERFSAMILGSNYAKPARKPGAPDPLLDLVTHQGVAGIRGRWPEHIELTEKHLARLARIDIEALKANRLAQRTGTRAVPPAMHMPCLLYAGDQEGDFYTGALATSQRIPDASFVGLPGCGHFDAFAKSALVLPLVRRFLAALQDA